jgi:hypothetical protein
MPSQSNKLTGTDRVLLEVMRDIGEINYDTLNAMSSQCVSSTGFYRAMGRLVAAGLVQRVPAKNSHGRACSVWIPTQNRGTQR